MHECVRPLAVAGSLPVAGGQGGHPGGGSDPQQGNCKHRLDYPLFPLTWAFYIFHHTISLSKKVEINTLIPQLNGRALNFLFTLL